MKSPDVVVVGGGLGGLMCAALLAKDGLRVNVFERASHVGGRAMSPRVAGSALNLGAHALYVGGPAERVLGALNVTIRGSKPRADDAWLTDVDGIFASPTSVMSLATSKMFSFGERISLMKFFTILETISPKEETTTAWLDRLALGPRARSFIDAMVRVATYSNMPDTLSARVTARQLQRAIGMRAKGVVYVDDGWQSIVDDVARVATDAGVVIETDSHVTSLEAIDAAHVVVALPRANAAHLVSSVSPPEHRVFAACIDMTIEGPISKRLVFGMDEPHYFSVHSATTAYALRYLAPNENGAEYKQSLETWLERVVPDLGAHVIGKRFLPAMEVASGIPMPDAVPEMDRVSFVGDWTSATFQLLDAVAESVETARARIVEERKRKAA